MDENNGWNLIVVSAELALEGHFDDLFGNLPGDLQHLVENIFHPLFQWDVLAPGHRREFARQWDLNNKQIHYGETAHLQSLADFHRAFGSVPSGYMVLPEIVAWIVASSGHTGTDQIRDAVGNAIEQLRKKCVAGDLVLHSASDAGAQTFCINGNIFANPIRLDLEENALVADDDASAAFKGQFLPLLHLRASKDEIQKLWPVAGQPTAIAAAVASDSSSSTVLNEPRAGGAPEIAVVARVRGNRGYDALDRPLVDEMLALIEATPGLTDTNAAKQVASRAQGNSFDAKVKRLVLRIQRRRGEARPILTNAE